MRLQRSKLVAAFLAALLATMGLVSVATPSPASAAATSGCYGPSCTGQNPEGKCSGDAKTVRAMHVTDGMLELRWSPSCVANWGRYSPYERTTCSYAAMKPPMGILARVTSWNPGGPSQDAANYGSSCPMESSWSAMVDGRYVACTGVEIIYYTDNADRRSIGWTWGPCY
ncbi:MAG TPA: DUF2690 domain-containing protein [Candidatus Saccharimonadales bacterium]|nr:DUF2690 domain-containing protein [Candidatus Saccharimonadales bacterium]